MDFDFIYARYESLRKVFSTENPFDGWGASVPATDADLTQIRVDVINITIDKLRYNKQKHSMDFTATYKAQRDANIALMDGEIDQSEYRRRMLSTGEHLYAHLQRLF